jgi:hypothetical protein
VSGFAGEREVLDPAATDGDEGEHVHAPAETCVRIAPRRRWQAGGGEDVADGARRDGDAQLAQLARDPQVAPARVIAGEPQYQLAHITADRRAARAAVRKGPAASNHPAMPAQKRLRPNEEGVPGAARQHATERGQQQPVVYLQSRPARLPAKNRQLVSEHEDLQLLRSITAANEHDQLEQPADNEVDG